MNAAVSQAGVVIVGSGLGGYTLARELRKLDKEMAVTMVTADGGEAYSKPMLSNALAQKKSPDDLVPKDSAVVAAELGMMLRTRTRVTAIDRAAKTLVLSDGATLAYDRLVLALGADPRPYRAAGSVTVPVHSVNDLDDYRRWRERLADGGRVLLIGAGLIGCEFANDLATGGHAVTMVEPGPWPVARLLPEPVGRQLAAALAGLGVDMRLGIGIERLEPGSALLSDGSRVAFDHALSAIGLVPRTALAEAAGLVLDRGAIAVDRTLRTSDPNIYALGDCAATTAGPLPFVLPLMAEARALAATLAGSETAVVLPALPVAVKTPCLPVVVCPPPVGAQGEWVVEGEGRDLKALFVAGGEAIGFALSGQRVGERQSLAAGMPAVLA